MEHSGNPVLKPEAFRTSSFASTEVMTQRGTYFKTAFLLLLCFFSGTFTFNSGGAVFLIPSLLVGFILALVTIFKKEWSPFTAPLYAICEGVLLGAISYIYQAQYSGIVMNAILLTFFVFAIMLGLYTTRIIKVTDKLRMGIVCATGAIALIYLVSFIMGFFGTSIPMIHSAGPIGIGFSFVVVGIAAFNLLLDFDSIESYAQSGRAPKYLEWFGAFGLVVTLVWLYLEILRLLSKMNRR